MRIIIELKQGSVVNEIVDAVVCSANNWLVLDSGNAGEIRVAGGNSIQEECNEIIEKNAHNPLEIGSAVVTKAGSLTTVDGYRKYIIHAIGMGYSKEVGNPNNRILATKDSVHTAVISTLKLADTMKIDSLVFPLMCSRPGYSIYKESEAPKLFLKEMIYTMEIFSKDHTFPHSIIIVVPNNELIEFGNQIITSFQE